MLQLELKAVLRQNSFLFWGIQIILLKPPIGWGSHNYREEWALLKVCRFKYSHLKNAFTATSHLVFDRTVEHRRLAMLTHKINESENKQMGLHQTKKLLHSKGNKTKGCLINWRRYTLDKGLISKIDKEPIQFYIKETIWLKKWAKDLYRYFSKKDNRHMKR